MNNILNNIQIISGTAVSINGAAVLIQGESNSGKSDLALRLMDRGATLISDDQVYFTQEDNHIILSPAPNIAGKMEIRQLGIVEFDAVSAALALIIQTSDNPDRFPLEEKCLEISGISFPVISLNALEASAPIKTEIALKALIGKNDA